MAYIDLLKEKLDKEDYEKLLAINNRELHEFMADYISLCKPDRVFIRSDLEKDMQFIRDKALGGGEERDLALKGHTIHFDGFHDQARDKEHTRFLVSKGEDLGPLIHSMDKEEGTREVRAILDGSMVGHTMYVGFFVLGPEGSEYSIPSVQITDSAYVMHSEDLLYRNGYQTFQKSGESNRFFRFVHSVAELDYSQRRIYIDVD
ncbi:MAG: phosphoenolpyruvate carboxykinase, partial [Candidatus Altiarchaeota archaeon]|nr:phosphoenolpyruvate carboxykinase [Candidatus Altiarchaeota archaeon]